MAAITRAAASAAGDAMTPSALRVAFGGFDVTPFSSLGRITKADLGGLKELARLTNTRATFDSFAGSLKSLLKRKGTAGIEGSFVEEFQQTLAAAKNTTQVRSAFQSFGLNVEEMSLASMRWYQRWWQGFKDFFSKHPLGTGVLFGILPSVLLSVPMFLDRAEAQKKQAEYEKQAAEGEKNSKALSGALVGINNILVYLAVGGGILLVVLIVFMAMFAGKGDSGSAPAPSSSMGGIDA